MRKESFLSDSVRSTRTEHVSMLNTKIELMFYERITAQMLSHIFYKLVTNCTDTCSLEYRTSCTLYIYESLYPHTNKLFGLLMTRTQKTGKLQVGKKHDESELRKEEEKNISSDVMALQYLRSKAIGTGKWCFAIFLSRCDSVRYCLFLFHTM